MIRVVYERELYRLTAEGHAGFAPCGHDLVCAGVSVLMQTLQRMVGQMEAEGTVTVSGQVIRGFGRQWCIPEEGCEDKLHAVMDTVAAGLEGLAESYPDYVSYTQR